jgi:signal transduction histidine kinase
MLASLALYSSARGRATLSEGVGLASEAIAESLSSSMDMLTQLRSHEVLTVVGCDCVIDGVSDSNAAFDAMGDPETYIDEIDENWTSVPMDDIPESMETILEGNISLMLRSQLVEHYSTEHGITVFGEVIITNKYGAIIAATHRPSDYRQDDETWWQNAFTGESELYHSDIEYDEGSSVYGICACIPMKDDAGVVIGVARAMINILAIANDIEHVSLGYETSELKITTSDGRLIFSSRAYIMLQNVSTSPFFEHATDMRGHFVEREGETNRLFSYVVSSGYHDYEGAKWLVFLSHSEDEVLGPATEMQIRVLTAATLALILGAVISLALSRSITGPIAALEKATRGMAKGEIDQRIPISRRDELGRLAESFNEMAAELNLLYTGLDNLVKERTKELEIANNKLSVLGSITRHDALNQIVVQKGWLGMAMEVSEDPVMTDYLRKVETATDNLVSFLKFTSEYEEIGVNKPEWANVQETLSSAIIGVDLTRVNLSNSLGSVEILVDPMFPKVLHNLIANSLKHGQKVTTISLSSSEGRDGLTIVVEDDGIGVAEDNKGLIFQREHMSGRRSHGLFLTAEILRMTDISIQETGTPGKGARFEMLVPRGSYRLIADSRKAASPDT